MTRRAARWIPCAAALVIAALAAQRVPGQDDVTSSAATAWDELSRTADGIRPTDEESRWMRIPWLRSASAGQKLARREGRPILFWNVDDDPLERC